jgi:hypothetical protein
MSKKLAVQNSEGVDDFFTPGPAILPLLAHIPRNWVIWECAAGSGNLVKAFRENGYEVLGTDIKDGTDFRMWEPDRFDCIVTNPPYSLKDEFLHRAYQLGKPFAMLIPLTSLEGKDRQRLFRNYGVEIIFFDKRINFECPDENKTKEKSGSWFPTAWFTWGLNLPKELNFVKYQG